MRAPNTIKLANLEISTTDEDEACELEAAKTDKRDAKELFEAIGKEVARFRRELEAAIMKHDEAHERWSRAFNRVRDL